VRAHQLLLGWGTKTPVLAKTSFWNQPAQLLAWLKNCKIVWESPEFVADMMELLESGHLLAILYLP
jgi:hypothetical protein